MALTCNDAEPVIARADNNHVGGDNNQLQGCLSMDQPDSFTAPASISSRGRIVSAARQRYAVVNTATGDVLDSGPRVRYAFADGHLNVGLHEAAALAHLDLTSLEWRLVWLLISKCADGGWTPVVGSALAAELGSTAPTVSRALAKLTRLRVILRSEYKEGRSNRYRLNPSHFFKGNAMSHRAAMAETGAYPVTRERHLKSVA